MSDCISTIPDIKLFNNHCDCEDCSDEREGFRFLESSTDLSTTTTTISNKTAAAIKSFISDLSVDVTVTKVNKD